MTKQKEYSVSVSIKELNIISEKIMIKFGDWSSCKYNFILFKFKFVFPNNYWIKRIKVKRKVYNWFPLVFFLFFFTLDKNGFLRLEHLFTLLLLFQIFYIEASFAVLWKQHILKLFKNCYKDGDTHNALSVLYLLLCLFKYPLFTILFIFLEI